MGEQGVGNRDRDGLRLLGRLEGVTVTEGRGWGRQMGGWNEQGKRAHGRRRPQL